MSTIQNDNTMRANYKSMKKQQLGKGPRFYAALKKKVTLFCRIASFV